MTTKKNSYAGGHMPKRSTIPGGGHGTSGRHDPGPVSPRSLNAQHRNELPGAGKRSGGPAKVNVKKP